MKFLTAFKAGFNVFANEKMNNPKLLGVSKSSRRKLYAAEIGLEIHSSAKNALKRGMKWR